MSYHREDCVMKVKKAVRGAYDGLRALRNSRSNIPLPLLVASNALDKLSSDLNLLASSEEALTIFCSFSVKVTSSSTGTLLSDALVQDMEAISTHLRLMIPSVSAGTPGQLKEDECQDIVDMVDRYDRTVCSVLTRHNMTTMNMLKTHNREILEGIDEIRLRLLEQQGSEVADMRTWVYERLKPLTSAHHDSDMAPKGCLKGTRVAIQEVLSAWANDGNPELSTLWLSGMAGTGKTAIASTFARNMDDEGMLVVTFFIDRQRAERQNLSRIVQTLAYHLAEHRRERLRALWKGLRNSPAFESRPYQDQIRHLIKVPLDAGGSEPMVILIDGLDECGASSGASLVKALIGSLSRHPIKLLVASRNEAGIADMFRDFPHCPMQLQDIDVSADIRLYWERNLDEVCHRKRLPDWRSMIALDELVGLTGDLFIYATTILEIIQDTRISPIKELVQLLEISRAGSGSVITFAGQAVHHGPLEKLYFHILTETVQDHRGNIKPEYVLRTHDILELVIFAREPFTHHALSDLLDMDKDELQTYLTLLRSVLLVPDVNSPEGVVRPLHQSFPDFVRQQGGLVHPDLTMHSTLAEKNIAERCFGQLNHLLRFDICRIKDASLFNHEVSDLPTRLNECVPAALRYSCRYWPSHFLEYIRAAGSQSLVPLGLNVFCREHLLHWVEVLSLTKNVNFVQPIMPRLISIISSHPDWKDGEFGPLLADTCFFMRDYQFPIALSALHVYHSGVVSMPQCALRRQAARHGMTRLISERARDWQTENMILEGHADIVDSVALSSDGLRIVSGSRDHTMRTWDASLGVVLYILEGHTDRVSSVAFSSDGWRIVSGSLDSTVRIWDATTGVGLYNLEGHTRPVRSVAFSSDGSRVVSRSDDCTVRIWDAVSGLVLHTLEAHATCSNTVAFSSDGSRIVSSSNDSTVRIWDAVSGVISHILSGHFDRVNAVAFSPDGLRIVSGSDDCSVRIWDAVTGMVQHILKGHTHFVLSVAFAPDGLRVVSSSDDCTMRIWDAVSGVVLHTLEAHTTCSNTVAFSSDGLRIVSFFDDRTVRTWDVDSGVVLHTLEHHTSSVPWLVLSSDGSRVVSVFYDCTMRIWDATTGVGLYTLSGHLDKVNAVAFSSDGLYIVSGSDDRTVRIWDAVSGVVLHTLEGHTTSVNTVAFLSNRLHIVSVSDDRTVRIWDDVVCVVQYTLQGHTKLVNSVVFSPNGLRIVSKSDDRIVHIWDAVSGEVLHIMEDHTIGVISVAFSSDGSRVVSAYDNCTVRIWDAVSGVVQHILEGHTQSVSWVAFSPDGSRIVSGSLDSTVRIWDATTGVGLYNLEGHTRSVRSVAFSSDGSRVVSSSDDCTLRIWDATTGVVLYTLKGHTDRVSSVAFSSDGWRIVSGSLDSTVRVWDAVSGMVLHILEGHTGRVNSVASSYDGSRTLSSSDDCTVRIWDAVSGVVSHTLSSHTSKVNMVAFSCDGLHIVSVSNDLTMHIWDTVSGVVQHTMEGHTKLVNSVAFSPDGLRIVSGSDDRSVRIWDTVTGMVQHILRGHVHFVLSIAFAPDGSRIVSGSRDYTMRIWDAVLGVVLHTLHGHTGPVASVAFSSDGLHIVSGSIDSTVRVWDAVSGMLQHVLKGYHPHNDLQFFLADSPLSQNIQIYQHQGGVAFQLEKDGWVHRRDVDGKWRRICWLPRTRRINGIIRACSGQKIAIIAEGGLLTILDFLDV